MIKEAREIKEKMISDAKGRSKSEADKMIQMRKMQLKVKRNQQLQILRIKLLIYL